MPPITTPLDRMTEALKDLVAREVERQTRRRLEGATAPVPVTIKRTYRGVAYHY